MASSKGTSIQQFFPCVPTLMSWEDWNGNMAIYFGQENIMDVPEEDWRSAANNMANMEVFAAYPVPSAERFETWEEWAIEFTLIINGPSY